MKVGYLRQDESSHWHLIPEDVIEEYDKLTYEIMNTLEYSDEFYDKLDTFNNNYSQYRLIGGPQMVKCIMDD